VLRAPKPQALNPQPHLGCLSSLLRAPPRGSSRQQECKRFRTHVHRLDASARRTHLQARQCTGRAVPPPSSKYIQLPPKAPGESATGRCCLPPFMLLLHAALPNSSLQGTRRRFPSPITSFRRIPLLLLRHAPPRPVSLVDPFRHLLHLLHPLLQEVCEKPAPVASTPSQDKNPDFTAHAQSSNIGPLPDGLARPGCTRPWALSVFSIAGHPSSARCTTCAELQCLARERAVRAAGGMGVLCVCVVCVRGLVFPARLRPLLPPALEGGREEGVWPRRPGPRCNVVNLYARSTPADVPCRRAAADEERPTW
jgi:hypothetical protein